MLVAGTTQNVSCCSVVQVEVLRPVRGIWQLSQSSPQLHERVAVIPMIAVVTTVDVAAAAANDASSCLLTCSVVAEDMEIDADGKVVAANRDLHWASVAFA